MRTGVRRRGIPIGILNARRSAIQGVRYFLTDQRFQKDRNINNNVLFNEQLIFNFFYDE